MKRVTVDDLLRQVDAAAEGGRVRPIEVELRDGSTAQLRPLLSSDKDRLARGLDEMSSRSRYMRFGSGMGRLTDGQLRYLTEIDYDDHVAWGALDPAHPERPGMGVGRYIRLREDPTVAELAVAVADEYQGRGLGTILFAVLAHTARAHGIDTFRNYVLAENDEMLELLDQLGARRRAVDDSMYEVDVPLPEDEDSIPDTPAGRVIRSFARRSWPWRLRQLIPPVWSGPEAGDVDADEADAGETVD